MTTRTTHRRTFAAALALTAAFALSACATAGTPLSEATDGAPAPAGSDETYTVKITDPGNNGYLALARKDGVLEEALEPLNAKVEWVPAKGAVSANLPLFSTGELQVSAGAYSPVVGAASADSPIRIGAVVHSDGPADDSGIVAKQGIDTVEDLVGSHIAINPSAKGEYIVLQALAQAGIDSSEVHLQYLQPAEGLAAFNAGKVDAVATFGDFFRQAKETGTVVATEGDIHSADTEIVLFTTDLLEARPDIAKAIVVALEPVVAGQSADPDASINVFTTSGPAALSGAALDWQRDIYAQPQTLGFAIDDDKKNLQAVIDLFARNGVIEEGVTADDLLADLG